MDWDATAAGFRRYLITHRKTPDTAKTYVERLRPFWNWRLGSEGDPRDVGYDAVEEYMAEQLGRVSLSTSQVTLCAIRCYFRWSLGLSDKEEPPQTNGLAVAKERLAPRPPCSEDEAIRLLTYARTDEERLLFLIGFGCGPRISELVRMSTSDLYPEHGYAILHGKGRKQRRVAPAPEVFAAIDKLMGGRSGRIFDLTREQARRIMRRVAKNADVRGFYPHRMRITWAHRFLAATHDLHSCQILMVHADPSQTAKYGAFDAQSVALDQMRNLVPPRAS
jgi:integrase/recombinase XerD